MSALPELNTLVRVALGEGAPVLPSRVEGVEGDDLLLAAPSYVGDVVGPRVGSTVSVHWTSARGVCSVPVEFVAAERSGIKLWRVRLNGGVEFSQRRRYARVTTGGPLSLAADDLETVRVGWMLDLSEGGVRARIAPGAFSSDEPVEVRLTVEGELVTLVGSVVRTAPPVGGFEEVTVSFPDDHHAADLVRRFVLQEQVRLRRLAAENG
ncbi:PilZ domain-containing protein [Motilibacter peucedani]|uniref:PilZ domain-containing protein n=1 Tax=Motilibacter peucedani TaxID=598650 RepID=A0A420XQN3_9ACTN|nr:PilZ domain-containing protein [Motilibacter peucedani]RKS75603.1 PilZ domain-containing protein [Motilibacter peucedani]